MKEGAEEKKRGERLDGEQENREQQGEQGPQSLWASHHPYLENPFVSQPCFHGSVH